jgi:paraquat-inducible protein A
MLRRPALFGRLLNQLRGRHSREQSREQLRKQSRKQSPDEPLDPRQGRVAPAAPHLLACEYCDTLHQRVAASAIEGRCTTCGAVLTRPLARSVDLPLALALTSLVALVVAHSNTIASIAVNERRQQASLWEAASVLQSQGATEISLLVLITTLFAPLLEAVVAVWILLPLRLGYAAPGAAVLLRLLQAVRPWVMVEVFMLGVLVATVKLSSIATIEPGVGLWAFGVAMASIAALGQSFDIQVIWQALRSCAPLPRPMGAR